eukprot:scpid48493/ scgid14609/ 
MRVLSVAAALLVCAVLTNAHFRLTHPAARYPDLDFLDNVRTATPCGVPFDDRAGNVTTRRITTLAAGSTIDVQWHLGYGHTGGVQFNLLTNTHTYKLHEPTWVATREPTTQHYSVQLPEGVSCGNSLHDVCTLQVRRQALEWGRNYIFHSCSDLKLVDSESLDCAELNGVTCSGRGSCMSGRCMCQQPYTGKWCEVDLFCQNGGDCNGNGNCVQVGNRTRECFCNAGWFGERCEKRSMITDPVVNPDDYSNSHDFSETYKMHWKIIDGAAPEIEIALQVQTASWVGLGWRPAGITSSCQATPRVLPPGNARRRCRPRPPGYRPPPPARPEGTAEPESHPEGTAEPEAHPEGHHTHPEGEPEGTAQPEGTAEPEAHPEGHGESETTAEPEGHGEPETTAEPEGHGEPETTAEPEGHGEPETHAEGTPESQPEGHSHPEGHPEGTAEPGGHAEGTAEPEGHSHPEGEPEGHSHPEGAPETTAEPEGHAEGTAEPESNPEGHPEELPFCEPGAKPMDRVPHVMEDGCDSNGECRRIYTWIADYDLKVVNFTMSMLTDELDIWIAIGISKNKRMPMTDISIAWINSSSSEAVIQDRWARTHSTPELDGDGDFSQISHASGMRVGRLSSFAFSRACSASNDYDYSLSDGDNYFFFGSGLVYQGRWVGMHLAETPTISSEFVHIDCSRPKPTCRPRPESEPETHPETHPE